MGWKMTMGEDNSRVQDRVQIPRTEPTKLLERDDIRATTRSFAPKVAGPAAVVVTQSDIGGLVKDERHRYVTLFQKFVHSYDVSPTSIGQSVGCSPKTQHLPSSMLSQHLSCLTSQLTSVQARLDLHLERGAADNHYRVPRSTDIADPKFWF